MARHYLTPRNLIGWLSDGWNMSEVRDQYLLALHALSKADPAKWATFVEAFKVLVMVECERALSMPSNDALVGVGMGRRLRDLRDDFVHIDMLVNKLRK